MRPACRPAKPHGSGIGLALAHQIALSHHGRLTLSDRDDTHGCIAAVRLPSSGR